MSARRGFSLLEVVFAVAIVVTALLGLQAAVTGGIDSASSSINRRAARELCRGKLEEILAGVEELEGEGEFENYPNFRWEATLEEQQLGMPETQTETIKLVTVKVTFPVLQGMQGGGGGGDGEEAADTTDDFELTAVFRERTQPK
ncbi:MAG: prepilin-type N-terminal cleavage/methylation domain-containing protein [Planctomycetes bacterium]|nr:prepilin-type N-terminal cleavage/methylation domain-containing protein [Planctomycetota bacterium]